MAERENESMMTKTAFLRLAMVGLSWLAAGLCLSAGGAITTNVSVASFSFTPSTVSIHVGDTVQWNWISGTHTSTSVPPPPGTGTWDSGAKSGGSFSVIFSSGGNFPYNCTIHPAFMSGSVSVAAAANQPPSVSITNPTSGATFAAPWTGTISASASDSDGSVTDVQFFRGTTSIGNATTVPYKQTVTNLSAGSYAFTAVATDNGGASTTSSVVNVSVVAPVDILLSAPRRLIANQFRFTYTANPGLSYVVQSGTALTSLATIMTNVAVSSSVNFTDVAATASQSFYRVVRLANP